MELGLCIEMVFNKLPFEQRFAKAAEAGLKNVEMWLVGRGDKGSPEALAKLADARGIRMTNTVIGSPDGKAGGRLTDPANRTAWLEQVKATLAFNRAAGIGATIVCTGNDVPGLSDAQMYESVVEGLKPTVELAEKGDITLLLEPLNTRCDHAGYWLTSSDRGAEICRKLDSPRMKLLFDCYHQQVTEGDLAAHIERNLDVIGHFHAAGVPGRHELYEGEINYPFLIRRIEQLGYRGVFGLEYKPTVDHAESVRKTVEHLTGG